MTFGFKDILKINNFDNNSKSTLDEWIYFLKNSEIKDEFRAKGIQEAKEKLRLDNLSGIEKEEYELYIKDQRNKAGEIKTAFIDGQLDAKKELLPLIELERKHKETAVINLFSNSKMSIDQIAAIFQGEEDDVLKILLKNGVKL